MLVELDVQVGFSEVLLGSRAKSSKELIACYGALLAHGTENDAEGVAAMIPGLQVSHVSAAMRALEGQGLLRRANERGVGSSASTRLPSFGAREAKVPRT